MNRYQSIRYLLRPSLLSGIVVALTTLCIIILNVWLFVTEDPTLRQYFFGPTGIFTALVANPDSQSALAGRIFNSQIIYYVLLGGAGVLAGMTVYTTLQGIGHLLQHISSDIADEQSDRGAYKQHIRDMFNRLAVRAIIFIAWMVYVTASATILLPFCSTLLQAGLQDTNAGIYGSLLYLVGGAALLLIGLHLQVIFARLLFLRLRLFSNIAS